MNSSKMVLALAVLLCGSGAALAQGSAAPPSKEPFAGAPKVIPFTLEQRLGFAQRVREALERTRGVKVVYQDVLGEGNGAWDPDPRYPTDTVNCITWLQLLMAEVYGGNQQEKQAVLDRVRYFDGHVGFGFRKHFTDQWTELDPMPLRRVDYSTCPNSAMSKMHLELEPARYQKNIRYACPLYHMDKTSFDLDVVPGQGLVQCSRFLPPGYFILFPVASERYLDKYAGLSGPMGQVHAVLVEVPNFPPPGGEPRDPAKYKVFHASITSGKVVETELGSFVLNMWNLYRGYMVYELVPDWDWRSTPTLTAEGKAIASCESALDGKVGKLFEHEAEQPAVRPTPKP
ncbi:MAG: N-acetylmuramoyl-L-alanine amidase-like domain-containing protein [Acidobacteriota bacterium]